MNNINNKLKKTEKYINEEQHKQQEYNENNDNKKPVNEVTHTDKT